MSQIFRLTPENKRLSVIIDRIIPSFFRERYPFYKKFIQYFLEYLEQRGNPYEQISNIMQFIDIDQIVNKKNSSNSEEQALGDQLIDQIYNQMLGDPAARYLSRFLDDVLYLKKQKGIFKYKGTKYAFLFFFLLILGGYFRISNIDGTNKLHNGIYNHNGTINYSATLAEVQPYVYLVESEFQPDEYESVIDVLNPAGMQAISAVVNQVRIDVGTDYTDIVPEFNSTDVYIGFYYDDTSTGGTETFFGYIRPFTKDVYEKVNIDGELEFQDGTLWNTTTQVLGGEIGGLLFRTSINTTNFTGVINKIKLLKSPTPNGNYYYDAQNTGTSEGIVLAESFLYNNREVTIYDNTLIDLMIQFTAVNGISVGPIGLTFQVGSYQAPTEGIGVWIIEDNFIVS